MKFETNVKDIKSRARRLGLLGYTIIPSLICSVAS